MKAMTKVRKSQPQVPTIQTIYFSKYKCGVMTISWPVCQC